MCHHVIFDPVPPAVKTAPPFKYDSPPLTLRCPSFKISYLKKKKAMEFCHALLFNSEKFVYFDVLITMDLGITLDLMAHVYGDIVKFFHCAIDIFPRN